MIRNTVDPEPPKGRPLGMETSEDRKQSPALPASTTNKDMKIPDRPDWFRGLDTFRACKVLR